MSIESTEDRLRQYFEGEIDEKIKRLKDKIDGFNLEEAYYFTVTSYDLQQPYAGKTNGWADPTGERAVDIVEIKETTNMIYENYLQLKDIIKNIIKKFSEEEIYLLKSHLGLIDGNIKTNKKMKIRRLIKQLDNKITAGIILYCEDILTY